MEPERLRNRIRSKLDRLSQDFSVYSLRYPAGAVLLLAAALVWGKYLAGLTMIAVTAVVGLLVKRADLNKLGIETATFFTVISGYHFGPETGAALAFFLIVAQLMTGTPGAYIIWVIPSFVAAGHFAGVFTSYSITLLGPAISAILQFLFVFFTAIFSRGKVPKYAQYAVFNFTFNLVLFNALGPEFLKLLNAGGI